MIIIVLIDAFATIIVVMVMVMVIMVMIVGKPVMIINVITCMMTLALGGLAEHHLNSNYRALEIRKS